MKLEGIDYYTAAYTIMSLLLQHFPYMITHTHVPIYPEAPCEDVKHEEDTDRESGLHGRMMEFDKI